MAKKMDPEVRARWVAALRSGEYKQAKEALRKKGAHCCLGVLCDLYAKEAGAKWSPRTLGGRADGFLYDSNGVPGATIAMWSGLYVGTNVRIKGMRLELAAHNDRGATFAQIADAIESQL